VEIRGGAGGGEAALFAGELFRMYSRYAERQGFAVRVMDTHPTPLGGFKQVVFAVEGEGAYGRLRYESGVHRVQRVPETEASGRIHTSTATVAVLPEAEEVEVEIRPDDLKMDTYRASGPGGQHMQKNETAVRITHVPTGIVVACQDERSQRRNRELALRVLRAKLWEIQEQERAHELREARRKQIGTGDRAEKIRTYNFPQTRVTDHRIGLTVHRLAEVLDGDLDQLIEPIFAAEVAESLAD
jgi:peptide chain release factor 1